LFAFPGSRFCYVHEDLAKIVRMSFGVTNVQVNVCGLSDKLIEKHIWFALITRFTMVKNISTSDHCMFLDEKDIYEGPSFDENSFDSINNLTFQDRLTLLMLSLL
jgi:hypothetical protein